MERALPLVPEKTDALERGLAAEAAPQHLLPTHPVEHLLTAARDPAPRNAALALQFGLHMVAREAMDAAVLAEFHRLGGLPSARCGLETLLGRDEDLTWEDVLGHTEDR